MQVDMTQADFEIDPFMYAGSTLGNALHSGLTLDEVFSCASLSTSFEGFDEAVSATIKLQELCMSIEPICDHCGISVRPRCNAEQAKTCHLNKESKMLQDSAAMSRRIDISAGKPAKAAQTRQKTQIALTMGIGGEEYQQIKLSSHHCGNSGFISLKQGSSELVLDVAEADTLIDNLNAILQHLQ